MLSTGGTPKEGGRASGGGAILLIFNSSSCFLGSDAVSVRMFCVLGAGRADDDGMPGVCRCFSFRFLKAKGGFRRRSFLFFESRFAASDAG